MNSAVASHLLGAIHKFIIIISTFFGSNCTECQYSGDGAQANWNLLTYYLAFRWHRGCECMCLTNTIPRMYEAKV